ncbi:MAG: AraC family transcriptional regulator ligand-binding domain-containing protein [Sandaracinaceae bacterium]
MSVRVASASDISEASCGMPRGDPLFIFRLTPVVLRLIDLAEDEAGALLTRCGLPKSAAVGAATAPLSRFQQLLDEAALRYGPGLGAAIAEAAPEGTYETAELLVRCAPTLDRGLSGLARYAPLINPVGRFEFRVEGELAELHYFVPGQRDVLGPVLNEFTIGYVVGALRKVMPAFAPRAVWFAHDAMGTETDFGAQEVGFGRATCGLAIEASLAERPLPTADPVVFRYLEKQAEARLEALGQRSFAAVVVDTIESRVGFRDAELKPVSKALGVSERTLQRRLMDEGTRFREVVDEARRRRAEAMLASGTPASTVADALGFSDVRSFRRAFRRWSE